MVKRILTCGLLVVAGLITTDTFAQGSSGRRAHIDTALSGAVRLDENPRVIVRYRDGAAERLKERYSRNGASVRRDHTGIKALALQVKREDIDTLANDPDVLSVSIDARVHG